MKYWSERKVISENNSMVLKMLSCGILVNSEFEYVIVVVKIQKDFMQFRF